MANQNLPAIQPPATAELYRQATDVAGVCRDIVLKTAVEIQGRKYVRVEGWQSIATAHGCVASARGVEKTEDGMRAIGEIRRMSDGQVIATAEGFVGKDEPIWYGGPDTVWDRVQRCEKEVIRPKRADYAIRAMAQTRAISRACRSAFAHVVVLIDAKLSTTPAEEVRASVDDAGEVVPEGGAYTGADPASVGKSVFPWRNVAIPFGKFKQKSLGWLSEHEQDYMMWLCREWQPKPLGTPPAVSQADRVFRLAVDDAMNELQIPAPRQGEQP
jgi:hypothetical protein